MEERLENQQDEDARDLQRKERLQSPSEEEKLRSPSLAEGADQSKEQEEQREELPGGQDESDAWAQRGGSPEDAEPPAVEDQGEPDDATSHLNEHFLKTCLTG